MKQTQEEVEPTEAPESHAARQRVHALGALSAGVANEISSPALTLRCNLAVVRQSLKAHVAGQPLGVEAIDHLLAVIEECESATRHVQRVAATFSAFASADPATRERVDLADLAHAAGMLVRHDVQQRARLVIGTSPVPAIDANRGQLIQLVIALITNAAEAMPLGEHEERTVTVTVERKSDAITVAVHDDGAGMAKAVLEKATEPWFSAKRGHAGLGLTLAQEITSAHGGSLEIRSTPGQGTRVAVQLPAPRCSRRPSPTPLAGPRLRVLVVDDDHLVRKVVGRLLRRDHEVHEADGGRAALELLSANTYDVIVSDLMMPGMDGRLLYEAASRQWPALEPRFVFFTGGAVGDEMQRFVAAMPGRVVNKDGGPLELVSHLARHFARVEPLGGE